MAEKANICGTRRASLSWLRIGPWSQFCRGPEAGNLSAANYQTEVMQNYHSGLGWRWYSADGLKYKRSDLTDDAGLWPAPSGLKGAEKPVMQGRLPPVK